MTVQKENDMGEPGVVEPRTERQKDLSRQLIDEIGEHYQALWLVAELEREARAAALDAAEEAVKGLTGMDVRIDREELRWDDIVDTRRFAVPPATVVVTNGSGPLVDRSAVLAAIANLRSDGETRTEPSLTIDNVTERERAAYWRGFHKKAIDGSHIPGSEAER